MVIDELLPLLEGVRPAGNGYEAICPAHEDRKSSLGVAEASDFEGIVLTCRAGCTTEAVLAELHHPTENRPLTVRDLYAQSGTNYGEPESIYDYVDEHGYMLFQAVRFPGKRFRQRHLEDGEWVWNLEGVRRVLYRLPEVIAAVQAGMTIYLVEGEKDVERLRAEGKVATCNPMGAGKWRAEYSEFLRGASVVIVADRDAPGRKHAETVRTSLQGIAAGIWVVQAKVGKDTSDHLDAGLAVEAMPLMRQRVRRGIITARELAEGGREDITLRPEDLPGYQLWPQIPLVFRQGRAYALGAYTGDGKSSASLMGLRTLAEEGRRVGYFSNEMPVRDLKNKLVAHKGVPLSVLEEPWRLRSDPAMLAIYEQAMDEIESWNVDFIFDSSITAKTVTEYTSDREYEAVFIDHLHRFAWKERRTLDEQVVALTNLALEQNVMMMLACQLRKFTRGKDVEVYPRPLLQDFRETSTIGDDASMALALWRQRDNSGFTYTGTTQMIVLKNRHTTGNSDAVGQVYFPYFDPIKQLFTTGPEGEQYSHEQRPDEGAGAGAAWTAGEGDGGDGEEDWIPGAS